MTETCPGCLAEFDAADGPTHRYIGASSGCWLQYGAYLASDSVKPIAVDIYAAQHPGEESPQATQSVAIHLVALDAVLTHNILQTRLVEVRTRAVEFGRSGNVRFTWMDPRPPDWAYTITDVIQGGDLGSWAADVRDRWWGLHGDRLSAWTEEVLREM